MKKKVLMAEIKQEESLCCISTTKETECTTIVCFALDKYFNIFSKVFTFALVVGKCGKEFRHLYMDRMMA